MKVFMVGTSFLPSYGGPARSITRLADSLVDSGVEVGLWSADNSILDTPFLKPSTKVHLLSGSLKDAISKFSAPDVIHDNGIWLPHNHKVASLARELRIPRIVSTRGMLSRWAWNHKRFKKRVAWSLYQKRDLGAAAVLHVTSSPEKYDLRSLGLGVPIKEIPNGVDVPAIGPKDMPDKASTRRAIFVGRIHPVKGLLMLVQAWAKVRPPNWEMVIVGPDEAGHRREVEASINRYGLEGVFRFTGPLDGVAKQQELLAAELFVLSSYTENFGIAAGEALAHGLPVLATQGTPWESLVDRNCGWWVPTNVDGIADGLRQATACHPKDLMDRGKIGRIFVRKSFGWGNIARQMSACYESLVS